MIDGKGIESVGDLFSISPQPRQANSHRCRIGSVRVIASTTNQHEPGALHRPAPGESHGSFLTGPRPRGVPLLSVGKFARSVRPPPVRALPHFPSNGFRR